MSKPKTSLPRFSRRYAKRMCDEGMRDVQPDAPAVLKPRRSLGSFSARRIGEGFSSISCLWMFIATPVNSRQIGTPQLLPLLLSPLSRHRRLQHPLGGRGGNGRLHALSHPQPVPAKHLAVPGPPGGHAGPERGADPGGGVGRGPDPGRDPRPHRVR